MDAYKVNLASVFEIELVKVYLHIHFKLGNPSAAWRLYQKVKKSIQELKDYAEVHPRIYELTDSEYRKMFVNKYVIVYEVNRELRQVCVLHIFHSSQNYLGLI